MTLDSCNDPKPKSHITFYKEEITRVETEDESCSYPLETLRVKLAPYQARDIINFIDEVILQLAVNDRFDWHFHLALQDLEWWDRYPDFTIYPARKPTLDLHEGSDCDEL